MPPIISATKGSLRILLLCQRRNSSDLSTTPMILDCPCARLRALILGTYSTSSRNLLTRSIVSAETSFVFPWMTFDTVVVLSPSLDAISLIVIISYPFRRVPYSLRNHYNKRRTDSIRFSCYFLWVVLIYSIVEKSFTDHHERRFYNTL